MLFYTLPIGLFDILMTLRGEKQYINKPSPINNMLSCHLKVMEDFKTGAKYLAPKFIILQKYLTPKFIILHKYLVPKFIILHKPLIPKFIILHKHLTPKFIILHKPLIPKFKILHKPLIRKFIIHKILLGNNFKNG